MLWKGLILANLSTWINFALSARCKYLNISSNLFRLSKSGDAAQLKILGAYSQYIWQHNSKVHPEIGMIARKAQNSSGVTWNVKFPLLLVYIFLLFTKMVYHFIIKIVQKVYAVLNQHQRGLVCFQIQIFLVVLLENLSWSIFVVMNL